MGKPTNLESRHFVRRTGRDVWTRPRPIGYQDSIQAAGSVAAPLLAGASFTLVALVLQSTTTFSRWQNLALFFFVAAGLAQIFAVQSIIWTRRYMVTPDELRQWFPDDFTDDGHSPTQWLLNIQAYSDQNARKWARRTRGWINTGISLLLAGIAVGVVPPGDIGPTRWAVVTVAWAGVAVEVAWVIGTLVDEQARRDMMLRSAAIIASGGATAAAGYAATSGTTDGAPATWWAVALAVLAVPFWLAELTDARFSYGHVRRCSRLTGWGAKAQAALALLAPAILVLALWSAIRQLISDRGEMLRSRHPGASDLLPKGVSINEHHRAWSRCTASLVTGMDELAKLLNESGRKLEPAGQPSLDGVWEHLARSPGCVVKVTDHVDPRIQFGYYAICPLLAETVRRIKSESITVGRQLSPGDLATSPDVAEGWYISTIWAPGRKWTRQCVIATLVDELAASGSGRTGRPVFAHPATTQGQALMDSYGFQPMGEQAGIWILEK
jgi:hypothetical protein